MYKYLFLFLIFGACTKDRVIADIPQDPIEVDGDRQVINYWSFNNDEPPTELMMPSFSFTVGQLIYRGNEQQLPYCDGGNQSCWESVNDGTELNAVNGAPAGRALRLRNPASELIIESSTVGFREIELSYAMKRTGSGAQVNAIFYSTDGSNFIFSGVEENVFTITEDYERIIFDVSNIPGLNNNPNVKFKIVFEDGNNNSSGNNRMDNLLITGVAM